MTIKKKQNKGGVTRSQLALIGVLVAVLVIVIVVQLPDSQPQSVASAETAENESTRNPMQSVLDSSNPSQDEQDERTTRTWPQFSSQQLGRLDPLSTPDWYNSILEVVEKEQDSETITEVAHDIELQEMQDTGTAIVLIAGSQRIAKVGDSRIRVGDKIDGYEVSNITSEGVILTKSKSR